MWAANCRVWSLSFKLSHSPTYLHVLEAHSHNKVGGPVCETGHSNGWRPGSLWEQLRHNEPGDGTRSDFKECDEGKNCNDAHIRHPFELVLKEQKGERLVIGNLSNHLQSIHIFDECVSGWWLTCRARAIVIKMADPAIPISPVRCRDRRPARSTTNSYRAWFLD